MEVLGQKMTRKGRRQKLKSGGECDIIGSWRKFYCYLKKPGVVKKIKRKLNKRWRQELKRWDNE